jgi:hypothetical protein
VIALMGHFIEPTANVRVGGRGVEQEARALERCREWSNEAALQVAVEAFDLALGARSIRSAQPRPEAVLLGECLQSRVPSMLACSIGIAIDDDRRGVVEEHLGRDAAEVPERLP